MSNIQLNETQLRIKKLAENIILKEKVERSSILAEMTQLNQMLTTDQQLELVKSIDMAPAIRFLAATGIRGDARTAMFARLAALEMENRR